VYLLEKLTDVDENYSFCKKNNTGLAEGTGTL